METSKEREQKFDKLRQGIVAQLLEKYPDIIFDVHEYGTKIIFFHPSYYDGIKLTKKKRAVHDKMFNLNSYFLTEVAAEQAIAKYIEAAKTKSKKCMKALRRLQQVLDFESSYCVEGDTHGVEDHPYISFEMGGFHFQFATGAE